MTPLRVSLMQLRVSQVRAVARDILLVTLQAPDGSALPGAQAGAHVDLHLPGGLVRQYSLTNATGETAMAHYQVAIGLDVGSRGGSAWVHAQLRVGTTLAVSEPRNLFPLDPAHRRVLLLAGGIGITPVYAMAQTAQALGLDWQLVACARSLGRIAFAEELMTLAPGRVHLHGDAEAGARLDFSHWLEAQPWDGVYACGPQPMLDDLLQRTAAWPAGRFRHEKFKAEAVDTTGDRAFELVLAKSDLATTVAATEPVIDALERLGIDIPFSCREGLCGTCECGWTEGDPDHRDSVLDAPARASGRFIPCVSRARGERLTLDL